MPLGEGGQGFGDAGEQFDLLVGDGFDKADDAAMFVGGGGAAGQVFEAADERTAEALEAVAVFGDGLALDGVEMLADFFGGVGTMVEEGDEGADGALEIDVIFP